MVCEVSTETVEHWLCTLYAGFAAEIRFAPDAEDSARSGAFGDDEQADDYLRRAGMAPHAMRRRLRAQTAALIEQHWSLIQYVARELLKHEEFDGDEAELICEVARGEATEADLELYRARRAATARAAKASA